jgi:hypothetical protein
LRRSSSERERESVGAAIRLSNKQIDSRASVWYYTRFGALPNYLSKQTSARYQNNPYPRRAAIISLIT